MRGRVADANGRPEQETAARGSSPKRRMMDFIRWCPLSRAFLLRICGVLEGTRFEDPLLNFLYPDDMLIGFTHDGFITLGPAGKGGKA